MKQEKTHIVIVAAFGLAMLLHTAAFAAEAFKVSVWRGETTYVKIPERLQDEMARLEALNQDGAGISLLRFDGVKYDKIEKAVKKDKNGKERTYNKVVGKETSFDVCKPWKKGGAGKPVMVKAAVSADAKPGARKFGPLTIDVIDRVLPPASEWKYFLDLWQHPWAVSRYFNVKPFSKEHYEKMEPVWRALADCGCKALTVTILDLPWNNQCYDGYHSMIRRVHAGDGKFDDSFEVDFTLFDEYVEFGRKCGLGPDIACYTMCPWGYMAAWEDENGEIHREKLLPGTPGFEKFWGGFLSSFAAHLEEKGWLKDAYMAMDERKPDDVREIVNLVHKYAPGLKIAMAGNRSPSEFKEIEIENYCQGLVHLRKHPKLLDELEPRRRKGCKTTFYVCCSAAHPNTFMDSPFYEAYWLGAYPAITGFDGFLRWAANSWPKDPYKDASFRSQSWKPGDTFLIYPNGELSSRLISLRNGVVAAEKLRILREAGVDVSKDVAGIKAKYGYKGAIRAAFDFEDFHRDMEKAVGKHAEASFWEKQTGKAALELEKEWKASK